MIKQLLAIAIASVVFTACNAPPVPVHHEGLEGTFYTRHCVRGEQSGRVKLVHPSNYLVYDHVYPPGSEVEVEMYSTRHIDLKIGGVPSRMAAREGPFPTDGAGIDAFLDKHFAREAPDLSAIDASLRESLVAGTAPIGSTKEEVLLALGYPSHIDRETPTWGLSRERILESEEWSYRYSEVVFVVIWHVYQFDKDGKLVNVIQ